MSGDLKIYNIHINIGLDIKSTILIYSICDSTIDYVLIVEERVPEINPSAVEKCVGRQVKQGFSSVFANFFSIFDDFSNWSTLKRLRNFVKTSNLPMICQKMKKSLVRHAFNKPIFRLIPGTDSITILYVDRRILILCILFEFDKQCF